MVCYISTIISVNAKGRISTNVSSTNNQKTKIHVLLYINIKVCVRVRRVFVHA